MYQNQNHINSKLAYFFRGIKKTNFIYDHVKETGSRTILWNETQLKIFDNTDGLVLFTLEKVNSFDDRSFIVLDNAIILIKGNKYGAINFNGVDIIDAEYDQIENASCFLITTLNGKHGLYHLDGLQVLKDVYDDIVIKPYFIEIVLDGKHGLFSYNGTMLIEPLYDEFDFWLHTIIAKQDGMHSALYSYTGKKLFDIEPYVFYNTCDYGILVVDTVHGKKGLYSLEGDLLIPIKYDDIFVNESCKERGIIVKRENKEGVFSLDGNLIVPVNFSRIRLDVCLHDNCYSRKYITVWNGSLCGVYSYDSTIVLPIIFDKILEFDEIKSKVVLNGKTGYYFALHDKFIEAEDFNLTKTGKYEFKINGSWQMQDLD